MRFALGTTCLHHMRRLAQSLGKGANFKNDRFHDSTSRYPRKSRAKEEARAGGWAVCLVTYVAAPAFDPALKVRDGGQLPLAWYAIFDAPSDAPPGGTGSFRAGAWMPSRSRIEHDEVVANILAAISNRVSYQVNYTSRRAAPFEGDVRAWFLRLRAAQCGAYSIWVAIWAKARTAECNPSCKRII
jgi:para-aminobenzoate synthetase/4-amino-4-deoxychorismate lyase